MDAGLLQFNYIWPAHSRIISPEMMTLWNDPEFPMYDVTLVGTDNERVVAHKIVLSMASDFFKQAFKDFSRELGNIPNEIIVATVTGNDLRNVVNFIYNGKIKLSAEQLFRFLGVAATLRIHEIGEVSPVTTASVISAEPLSLAAENMSSEQENDLLGQSETKHEVMLPEDDASDEFSPPSTLPFMGTTPTYGKRIANFSLPKASKVPKATFLINGNPISNNLKSRKLIYGPPKKASPAFKKQTNCRKGVCNICRTYVKTLSKCIACKEFVCDEASCRQRNKLYSRLVPDPDKNTVKCVICL